MSEYTVGKIEFEDNRMRRVDHMEIPFSQIDFTYLGQKESVDIKNVITEIEFVALKYALGHLTNQERWVINHDFGLIKSWSLGKFIKYPVLGRKKMAEILGVSNKEIHKIRDSALSKLVKYFVGSSKIKI